MSKHRNKYRLFRSGIVHNNCFGINDYSILLESLKFQPSFFKGIINILKIMAKLITNRIAAERNQIVSILNWGNKITINLKSGNGICLNDNSHYDSIVQWWRSNCEEDLVLNELPKCCSCNKCWNN